MAIIQITELGPNDMFAAYADIIIGTVLDVPLEQIKTWYDGWDYVTGAEILTSRFPIISDLKTLNLYQFKYKVLFK